MFLLFKYLTGGGPCLHGKLFSKFNHKKVHVALHFHISSSRVALSQREKIWH